MAPQSMQVAPAVGRDGCQVTVCRACCCGDLGKHPGIDHDELLGGMVRLLGDRGTVRVAECLEACAYSNVVVVSPSPSQRRYGARPVWLAHILTNRLNEVIAEWVRAGGPGMAQMPTALQPHLTSPPHAKRSKARMQ